MINQQIGGVVLTRMRWNKPQWYIFNIGLLIWQLLAMAWWYRLNHHARWAVRLITLVEVFAIIYGLDLGTAALIWLLSLLVYTLYGPGERITLSRMVEAAQYCHVRLCVSRENENTSVYKYISFTAPRIKFDYFSAGQISASRGRFVYYSPNFMLDDVQQARLLSAAQDKYGDIQARLYDYLQLLSFVAHLPIWMLYDPWWGRELFKTLNLPGGRTVCSAGVIELLRFVLDAIIKLLKGYETPMVSPCLIAISKHFKREL